MDLGSTNIKYTLGLHAPIKFRVVKTPNVGVPKGLRVSDPEYNLSLWTQTKPLFFLMGLQELDLIFEYMNGNGKTNRNTDGQTDMEVDLAI